MFCDDSASTAAGRVRRRAMTLRRASSACLMTWRMTSARPCPVAFAPGARFACCAAREVLAPCCAAARARRCRCERLRPARGERLLARICLRARHRRGRPAPPGRRTRAATACGPGCGPVACAARMRTARRESSHQPRVSFHVPSALGRAAVSACPPRHGADASRSRHRAARSQVAARASRARGESDWCKGTDGRELAESKRAQAEYAQRRKRLEKEMMSLEAALERAARCARRLARGRNKAQAEVPLLRARR